MSTLTWVTQKELKRGIQNKGDEFRSPGSALSPRVRGAHPPLGAKKCALPGSQVIGLKIIDKESGMFSSFIFKTKGYFNLFAENKDERFFPEYMCIFFKII